MNSQKKYLKLDLHGYTVRDTNKILRICLNSLLSDEYKYALLIHGFRRGHILRDFIWKSIKSGNLFGVPIPNGSGVELHQVKGNPGATVIYISKGVAS